MLDAHNDSSYVFIAKDGKAIKRKVKVGMIWGNHTEILDGISDSDVVIVNGQRGLQDGMAISVVKR